MLFTNEARMSLEHFCWLLAIGYEARLTGQGSQNGLDVPKPRVTTLLFTGFSGGFTWSRGYEYGYSVGKWGCRFRMNCPGCPRRTPWELSPSGSQLCMDIQVGQTFLGLSMARYSRPRDTRPTGHWCHLEPRLHVPGHTYLSLNGISLFSPG